MKKSIALLISITAILLFPFSSFAADQYSNTDQSASSTTKREKVEQMRGKMGKMSVDQRIAMHEEMIKIHQAAIDCLKSNTAPMECMKNFKNSMQDVHKKYWPNVKMKRDCHNMM